MNAPLRSAGPTGWRPIASTISAALSIKPGPIAIGGLGAWKFGASKYWADAGTAPSNSPAIAKLASLMEHLQRGAMLCANASRPVGTSSTIRADLGRACGASWYAARRYWARLAALTGAKGREELRDVVLRRLERCYEPHQQ